MAILTEEQINEIIAENLPSNGAKEIGADKVRETLALIVGKIFDVESLQGATFGSLKGVGGLSASTLVKVGMTVNWLGFDEVGDGGANNGIIVPKDSGTEAEGYWYLVGSDLQVKALFPNAIPSVRQLGAVGVGDVSSAFKTVDGLIVPTGSYSADPFPFTKASLRGYGANLNQQATTGNFLSFYDAEGGEVSGINPTMNKGGNAATQGHVMAFRDGNAFTVSDINMYDMEGSGFGILAYPDSLDFQEKLLIKNIRGTYNQDAANSTSGLVLLALAQKSIVTNIFADGFKQFGAVELKDDASHNIINGVIGDGCDNTTYCGTETDNTPHLNLATNIIAKKPAYSGLNNGGGDKNLYSNVIIDFTDSLATQPHGITTDGEGNAFSNLMLSGFSDLNAVGDPAVTYAIRFRDGAKNNFASCYAHYQSNRLATFETGSKRNFVEVLHPADRVDIFNTSSAVAGRQTIDGSPDSNVIHAPAIGSYFGSMSGKFEWRIKYVDVPGSTLFSGDVFRHISDGNVGYALGGGVTANIKLFKSDGVYRNISLGTNNTLRLSTSVSGYLDLAQTALTMNGDNETALGSGSKRFSTVYAGTGAINTSDERAKQQVSEIDAKVFKAWGKVNFLQYRFNDAVIEKGESARWHFGLIAQRVIEAFESEGLNAFDYGLICYDEWDEVQEETVTEKNDDGTETTRVVTDYMASGNRYGIRYEEALALECAYLRAKLKA